ncbi:MULTISPECIES: N-6 DNA methylase [Aeromonas]|uniref:N-6 DNA methylase n=2 Tax=Aeromonadaceae TaxID=84642 RepID=UPI0011175F82|nr:MULTISPECIES: N-6 DNA methylase [Aeromonas]MDY7764074.1 N-6 DNA methylase [Aeromonas caviae]TNI49431.1 hypothetical protein CF125_19275 [Aeromonas veronii]
MKKAQSNNRGMTIRKELSQYYTTPDLGKELMSLIPAEHVVNSIIDLGAGEGALLISACDRYSRASIYGIDIDPENIDIIKSSHPEYNIFQGDSTQDKTIKKVRSLCYGFDLVIGNPPFKDMLITDDIRVNIEGLGFSKNQVQVRSELIFLMNGLKLLNDNGILAYILPDGFFTNINFITVREFICKNFQILNVREVPAGTFSGTEAKTHILVIKKSTPQFGVVVTKVGMADRSINITEDCFIKRGDYSFYSQPKSISFDSLRTINAILIRGRESKSDGINNMLHTTSFKSQYNEFRLNNNDEIHDSRVAKPGDIVIPRVGTRCLGKLGVIRSGYFRITDCLIIIRIDDNILREKVINSLKSDFGINWIKSTAKGVGAKHITLSDLKSFPII